MFTLSFFLRFRFFKIKNISAFLAAAVVFTQNAGNPVTPVIKTTLYKEKKKPHRGFINQFGAAGLTKD